MEKKLLLRQVVSSRRPVIVVKNGEPVASFPYEVFDLGSSKVKPSYVVVLRGEHAKRWVEEIRETLSTVSALVGVPVLCLPQGTDLELYEVDA